MQCLGITKQHKRCKNNCKLLFCKKHILQPFVFILAILSFIGLLAGLYQDIWKDFTDNNITQNLINKNVNKVSIENIRTYSNNNINKIEIIFSNTFNEDILIKKLFINLVYTRSVMCLEPPSYPTYNFSNMINILDYNDKNISISLPYITNNKEFSDFIIKSYGTISPKCQTTGIEFNFETSIVVEKNKYKFIYINLPKTLIGKLNPSTRSIIFPCPPSNKCNYKDLRLIKKCEQRNKKRYNECRKRVEAEINLKITEGVKFAIEFDQDKMEKRGEEKLNLYISAYTSKGLIKYKKIAK